MSFKYIRITFLTMILACSICLASWAEGYSSQIDSVKVKSIDDKSVIVDVYIKSDDPNLKPEISSRKYKDDKYIIDLLKVTNKGGVVKDTSASSGLFQQKDVRVGNLSGGTARVLLNLSTPDVNVKEVRYHVVKDQKLVKPDSPSVIVEKKPVSAPVKLIKPEPKSVINEPVKTSGLQSVKKDPVQQQQTTSKPEKVKKIEQIAIQDSKKQALTSPQIVHKTDKPVKQIVESQPAKPIVVKKDKEEATDNENILPATYIKPASKKNVDDTRPVEKLVVKDSSEDQPLFKKTDMKSINNYPDIDETFLVQTSPASKPIPGKEILEPGQLPVNFAEEESGDVRSLQADKGGLDFGKLLTSIGLALVIIIPLIILTVWLISIFQKASGGPVGINAFTGGSTDRFKIVSSTTLGQGKSIHLVEIKGRQLVIGCTNNSINILTEFGDFDQFVDEQRQDEEAGPQSQGKKELKSSVLPSTPKYKKSRPPLGSFADLYKDYQKKIDDNDLEDEY